MNYRNFNPLSPKSVFLILMLLKKSDFMQENLSILVDLRFFRFSRTFSISIWLMDWHLSTLKLELLNLPGNHKSQPGVGANNAILG